MRSLFVTLLAALLLTGMGSGAAVAAETSVPDSACAQSPCTLAEAIHLAVKDHPLVRAAHADTESFEAKLRAVKLAWIPTIKSRSLVSATPGKWGTPEKGGTYYDLEDWRPMVRFEVSGTMPVYGWGKIALLKKMAQQGLRVGRAQVQIAQANIELLVVRAYYSLQFADEMVDLLHDGEKYLSRARKYLEKLRDEDSEEYDDVDMLRLKVYESEVSGYRLDAARLRELSLSGLNKLTGESTVAFDPPGKLAMLQADLDPLDHYLELAEEHRGELVSLAAAGQVRKLQVSFEKRRFLPDFFLGAYFTYARAWAVEQQKSPFAYDPYNSWFAGAGLGLEWRLDPARQILALDEARAASRKAEAQHEAVRQKVHMEVEEAWREVRDQREKVRLARKAYKAARGWVIARLDTYESGMGSFRDVADALGAFFKQRMSYAQAQLDYNVGLARLGHECGLSILNMIKSE